MQFCHIQLFLCIALPLPHPPNRTTVIPGVVGGATVIPGVVGGLTVTVTVIVIVSLAIAIAFWRYNITCPVRLVTQHGTKCHVFIMLQYVFDTSL